MKRFLLFAAIVVFVLAGLAATVPFALSTQIVKQRIADQMAEWTGRKVTFAGDPRAALFPDLKITIDQVTIGDPGGVKPLAAVPTLSGSVRIAPLFLGRIEIVEFRLNSPVIHLRRDADGRENWNLRPLPGRQPSVQGRHGPQLVLDLRKARVRDGVITFDDAATERHEEFTATDLALAWPSASEAAGAGSFVWRGEKVEFNGTIGNPIALIEGKTSPARLAIASTPIRAAFTGKATRLGAFQFEGTTTVSTPSMRRLAGWLGAPMAESSVLGAASIEGKVNWTGASVSFSEAHIELDGNAADGSVAADLGGAVPSVQGTLALETLDLSPYLEAYRAGLSVDGPWPLTPISLPLLGAADVDLRLSAEQMLIGASRVGRVAMAAAIKDRQFAIQIGDARIYGGTLAATFKGGMRDNGFAGTIEAKVANLPTGVALKDLTGLGSIDGMGTLSVKVEGSGETWSEFAHRLAGTASLSLADGALTGLDLTRIATRLRGDPVAAGVNFDSTSFSSAACNLTIADGAIRTDDLHAEGAKFRIDLTGEASLFNPAVSGLGTLTVVEPAEKPLPFELSGTWQDPELFPDFGRIIRRSEADRPTPPVRAAAGGNVPQVIR